MMEVKGDWEDAKPQITIKVQKCGCNSAGPLLPSLLALAVSAGTVIFVAVS
jgi:hypothetical protein